MSGLQLISPFGDFILKNVAKNGDATRTIISQSKYKSLARVLGETSEENADKLQAQLRNLQETNLLAYATSKEVDKMKSGLQRFKSIESQNSFIDDVSEKQIGLSPQHESNAEVHWWEIQQSDSANILPDKLDSKNKEKHSKIKEVTICVVDDARKKKDTFLCPRDLLLKEMPYFEKFLDSEEDCEVQFSVHCDVEVFKRLLLFASSDEVDRDEFPIESKYAIHMLVSAEFLQMNLLVEKCLNYCHSNMNLLLSLSGIIGLLNESLLARLASLFKPEEIPNLDDPHDKIKSKLFQKLSEALLCASKLRKCHLCEKIFTAEIENFTKCLPTRTSINKKGEIQFNHKNDSSWNKTSYLQSVHVEFKTWEKTYWIMWGTVNSFPCCTCQRVFCCKEYGLCKYHPEPPNFPEPTMRQQGGQEQHMVAHSSGHFPCCGQKVSKFNLMDPFQLDTGCSFRNHLLPQHLRQSTVFLTLSVNKSFACLPIPHTNRSNCSGTDYKTLCKWNDDKISRPMIKSSSSSTLSKGSLNIQKPRNDDGSRDRIPSFRLLPGRSETHDRVQQQDRLLWNPSNSVWHNQDSIREYDYVGMEAVISHIKQH